MEAKKVVLDFGKVSVPYYNAGRKSCQVTVECNVRTWNGFEQVSISALVWNARHTDCIMAGQCLDSIKGVKNGSLFNQVKSIWQKYHLKPLADMTLEDKEFYLGLFN